MRRPEQDEPLTRTAPGNPMGEIFRRYWILALLSEELLENHGLPVGVQLLSEKLIAFRDAMGRYRLLEEFCAHHASRCGLDAMKNVARAAPVMAGNTR